MLINYWKTKPFKKKSIDKKRESQVKQKRPKAQVKKERPTETALFEEEKAFFLRKKSPLLFENRPLPFLIGSSLNTEKKGLFEKSQGLSRKKNFFLKKLFLNR